MTKLTYAIKNGDNIMSLWESEKLGKVLITNGTLDLSKDLIIRNIETLEDEEHVDLKEFLLKVFNKTTE